MKGGTIYLEMVAALMLLAVGTVMYVSGGFQNFSDQFGLIGAAGFVVVFNLVALGFIIFVGGLDGSVLRNWWHKLLMLGGINKMPRYFYLRLFKSSCRSCPFISICLKN